MGGCMKETYKSEHKKYSSIFFFSYILVVAYMIMIKELYTNNRKKGLSITLGICDNVHF
jgi:hypothetical protein